MNDRVFIDTNILVYSSLTDESAKHELSVSFLESLRGKTIFVSAQVMSELYVALLKHQMEEGRIVKVLKEVAKVFNVDAITLNTVVSAWNIKKTYRLSYWDSLIVASALESGCKALYTEDMQHGQVIGKKLKILNPFV
jgi:predicted nucleic acid-binding protein